MDPNGGLPNRTKHRIMAWVVPFPKIWQMNRFSSGSSTKWQDHREGGQPKLHNPNKSNQPGSLLRVIYPTSKTYESSTCQLMLLGGLAFSGCRTKKWWASAKGFLISKAQAWNGIYHLESRWRNSHVLVCHGPLLIHLLGVEPSTFTTG